MTTTDVTPDPSAVLQALYRQRDALGYVLTRLAAVLDSTDPTASPHAWFGLAEKAHAASYRELERSLVEGRAATDRARTNTSAAIWELSSRV